MDDTLTYESLRATMRRLCEVIQPAPPAPRIVESIFATEEAEDWSRVRSPGRARRRRGKHQQNIRIWRKPAAYKIDGVIYAHPEMVRAMRRAIADREGTG